MTARPMSSFRVNPNSLLCRTISAQMLFDHRMHHSAIPDAIEYASVILEKNKFGSTALE